MFTDFVATKCDYHCEIILHRSGRLNRDTASILHQFVKIQELI
jgi:hypothetical protein